MATEEIDALSVKQAEASNVPVLKMRSMKGFRSVPEKVFAITNPAWLYEPTTVDMMIPTKYTPDFYNPKTNTYVEIKGRMGLEDLRKVLAFRDMGYNIVVGLQRKYVRFGESKCTTIEFRLQKEGIKFFYVTDAYNSIKD